MKAEIQERRPIHGSRTTHTAVRAFALAVLLCNAGGAGLLGSTASAAERLLESHSSPAKVSGGSQLLEELRQAPGPLRPIYVAQRMLEEGPVATEQMLRAFEEAATNAITKGLPHDQLAVVGTAVYATAPLLTRLIETADLPDSARVDATSITLDILGRQPSAANMDHLQRVMLRINTIPADSVKALRQRVLRAFRSHSSSGFLDANSFAEFMGEMAPSRGERPSPLADAILDGVATADNAHAAAATLLALFREQRSLRGSTLNKLHGLVQRAAVSLDPGDAELVRRQLHQSDPFLRREAAFTLGFLGDHSSIVMLIDVLEDEAETVRIAAHDALMRMTSMTISASPDRWRYWYAKQTAWWDTEGQTMLQRLATAPNGDLVPILKVVGTKRLFHKEIAPHILKLTERRDSQVVEVAVSALAMLRAPEAIPTLRKLMSHRDPLVRQRAEEALSAMGVPVLQIGALREQEASLLR